MLNLTNRVRSLSACLLALAMCVLCARVPAVANPPCPSDLDGDGSVGGGDLSLVLLDWGDCPVDPPSISAISPAYGPTAGGTAITITGSALTGATGVTVRGNAANGFGLYDMAGNVGEWCQDWYGAYESGEQTNPTGPAPSSGRVLRGGAWGSSSYYCRASSRYPGTPGYRGYDFGFRVARTP